MNTVLTIPETVLVWQFGGKVGNLKSQNRYSPGNGADGYYLLSRTSNKYLDNVDTSVGINLDLTKDERRRPVWIMVPDGTEREVLTKETIALGFGGGTAFVTNESRTIGIDLDWNPPPKNSPPDPTQKQFQWIIFGADSQSGKPIQMNSPVALFNVKAGDFLIEGERVGGDVKFSKEGALPGWLSQIDALAEFLMQ